MLKKIKNLCMEKEITLAELERATDISNGSIRRWDTVSPNIKNVEKVADYFHVSLDYLMDKDINSDLCSDAMAVARNFNNLPEEKKALFKQLLDSIN